MGMFCSQCQEAAGGKGCSIRGVCGKQDTTSNLQDLAIFLTKGISIYALELKKAGEKTAEADKFVMETLFMTITNANFDDAAFVRKIKSGFAVRDNLKNIAAKKGIKVDTTFEGTTWTAANETDFAAKAVNVGILSTVNEDIRSLRQLVVLGVKGMAAYAEHAYNLGLQDDEVFTFMEKALAATVDDTLDGGALTALVLETGKYGVTTMALLDKANTSAYGNPEITKVNIGVKNNPGILISGHDLRDLEDFAKTD